MISLFESKLEFVNIKNGRLCSGVSSSFWAKWLYTLTMNEKSHKKFFFGHFWIDLKNDIKSIESYELLTEVHKGRWRDSYTLGISTY